jgi:hypothetical protein
MFTSQGKFQNNLEMIQRGDAAVDIGGGLSIVKFLVMPSYGVGWPKVGPSQAVITVISGQN